MLDSKQCKLDYEAKLPLYEIMGNKFKELLEELLKNEDIKSASVTKRIKTPKSFLEKITRSDKNYKDPLNEVTDLCGLRITVRTLSDVKNVGELLKKEFILDVENSISKLDEMKADQFGYLSEHYVVELKTARGKLPEWKNFKKLKAEIQVRTFLQHAWAEVQHSLDYKNTQDIPKELRRKLFRLSALFELADEELNQISDDAYKLFKHYEKNIQSNIKSVEINADSFKAYIEKSKSLHRWAKKIKNLGIEMRDSETFSITISLAQTAGITNFEQIENLLKESEGWGMSYIKEIYDSFHKAKGSAQAGCTPQGIITFLLTARYPEQLTLELLKKAGWTNAKYAVEAAKKFGPLNKMKK
jgi:ppGpp synthetase/RelA/SpoT-type nucleotidyltranferase